MHIAIHIHIRDGFFFGKDKIRFGLVPFNMFQLIPLVGFKEDCGYVVGLIHGMGLIDADCDEVANFSYGRIVRVGRIQIGLQRNFLHGLFAARDRIALIMDFDEQLIAGGAGQESHGMHSFLSLNVRGIEHRYQDDDMKHHNDHGKQHGERDRNGGV